MWSDNVRVTVFLILGVYFGKRLSFGDAIVFAIAFLLSILFFGKNKSERLSVFLAFYVGVLGYHYVMSDSIRELYQFNDNYVSMYGKIVDIPTVEGEVNSYVADVRVLDYRGRRHEVNERVRIRSEKKFEFGDSIVVDGFLKTFNDILNGGDFDNKISNKSKGIHFSMYAENARKHDAHFKSFAPDYYVNFIKDKMIKLIHKRYDGDEAAVIQAVFTGNKQAFSDDYEKVLYKSNTMRLFYPAYIHISFILMLVGIFSSYIAKRTRNIIIMIILVLYGIFNITTGYIVKSAFFMVCMIYMKEKYGFSDYKGMLAEVLEWMVILNPLIVYNTGLICSVASGLLIYYFVPLAAERMTFIKNRKIRRRVALWLVISVGMFPIHAYIFNNVTLYSFWLNFLYIPILAALWILVPVDFIIFGIWNLNPAFLMIKGILAFVRIFPELLIKLPGYSLMTARPAVSLIIIFYLILYVFYRKTVRKKDNDFMIVGAKAVILGLGVVLAVGNILSLNKLKLEFVNVGQGDGAVLSVPLKETVIIDGGGSMEYSHYNYGEKVFLPYLERNGYIDIDLAIVSHYHSDHCRGVIAAMQELKVKEVLIPSCMEGNKYRTEIENIARKKGIKISYYGPGIEITYPSGLTFSIISPDEKDLTAGNENDTSFGIRVSYGDFSALFTGDISETVEKNHSGEWGDTDVLKVAHHGSEDSSSEEFLNETMPEIAVISVGEKNSYNLPDKDVLKRLEKIGSCIYRTDKDGVVTVNAKKDGSYQVIKIRG